MPKRLEVGGQCGARTRPPHQITCEGDIVELADRSRRCRACHMLKNGWKARDIALVLMMRRDPELLAQALADAHAALQARFRANRGHG